MLPYKKNLFERKGKSNFLQKQRFPEKSQENLLGSRIKSCINVTRVTVMRVTVTFPLEILKEVTSTLDEESKRVIMQIKHKK